MDNFDSEIPYASMLVRSNQTLPMYRDTFDFTFNTYTIYTIKCPINVYDKRLYKTWIIWVRSHPLVTLSLHINIIYWGDKFLLFNLNGHDTISFWVRVVDFLEVWRYVTPLLVGWGDFLVWQKKTVEYFRFSYNRFDTKIFVEG